MKYAKIERKGTVTNSNEITYLTGNESITINGHEPTSKQDVYFVDIGDYLILTADIVDEDGNIQPQIDQNLLGYPPVLALPFTKYSNGSSGHVIDEVYFKASINNGIITSTGDLPSKGNWQLTTDRVNNSISAIGAQWKIKDAEFNFIVS